jgi:hypothetical protein
MPASLGCGGHVSMVSPQTVRRSTIGAHDNGTRVQGALLGSVGPTFAHGGNDLGELSVVRFKLLSFGSARDEGVSIAGYAPAPFTIVVAAPKASSQGIPNNPE